ncbi:MAG: Crp/Fnr family transcriptional regulator [Ectothiorhodospiraceae bacterium]|nr:Crp/Fnr family transcriptional regulator [Chromatiales bacterium]MCP5154111.1 Crp/Fnr family transcriptional regulator [Ectothiorhodospiraceae bacterium]
MANADKPDFETLRRIHLFDGMDDPQIEVIRRTMRVRLLDDGERLFDFGQPPMHFFFLRQGQVKLFRTSADGSEKIIEIIRPGETFAEAVMFMRRRVGYPVSAEAIAPSVVWAFDSEAMIGLLRDSVDTCFRLMASLSVRLRQQIDEIDRLTLHDATYRVVSFLLDQVPETTRPGTEVHLTMPKNVLASRLAIQPETFSRILARLSRAGLLRVQRSDIVLEDLGRLQEMTAHGP